MGAPGDGWRYIAQRFDGTAGSFGEFIDFNLPLSDVEISDVLSGHNSLSGVIQPEYLRLKGPDGRPVLEEGGTAIWAEDPSGEIRGGGLLDHSGFGADGDWRLECIALTGTSIDMPYDGADFFTFVDPLDLFRHIWRKIQEHPHSNVGLTIDPLTSPVRLGTELVQLVDFDLEPDPSEPGGLDPDDLDPVPPPVSPPRYPTNVLWREAAVKALKARSWKDKDVDAALRKWLRKDELVAAKEWKALTEKERRIRDRAIETIGWPPDPPEPGFRQSTLVVNMRPQLKPPDGGEIVDDPTDPVDPTNPEVPKVFQYDAYKLNWYETLDLSSEIDSLAADTPFDWHLVSSWDQSNEIRHHIRLGYPRMGRRRDELRLVVGENIHTIPEVERDGTERANEVWVYGAGEGSTIIRGVAFRRDDGRVRKIATVSDPSITTQAAAIQRAERELAVRFNIEDITEVVLVDHPHAPMGSIDLGDEVLIQGDIGWVEFATWCRVVGRTYRPDDGDQQTLTLIRSDRIA